MKNMKKLFAVLLALVMALSLAMPVMAADGDPTGGDQNVVTKPTGTYSITIKGSKSNANVESTKGHQYIAFQILTGTTQQNAVDSTKVDFSVTGWGYHVKNGDAMLTALKSVTHFGTPSPFAAVTDLQGFVKVLSDFTSRQVQDLIKYMKDAGYLKTDDYYTAQYIGEDTDKKAIYRIQDIPEGYYLIKDKAESIAETEEKDYTEFIMHVTRANSTVYHKGSIPTIKKEVSKYGSDYGSSIEMEMQQVYYYRLTATLPSDYESYSAYELVFNDTLSAGIDLAADYQNGQIIPATGIVEVYAKHIIGGGTETLTHYDVSYVTNANGTKTLSIAFDNLKHKDADGNVVHNLAKNDQIIIIYKAKLNENAVIGGAGNDNKVSLQFSNDPNYTSTGTTKETSSKVYTTGFHLTKKAGDKADKVMDGVKFRLYRTVTVPNADGTGTNQYIEYAVVTNGVVTAWMHENQITEGDKSTAIIVTDANSTLSVKGLDPQASYYLEEIETKPGYNLPNEHIAIDFTMTYDANGNVTDVVLETGNSTLSDYTGNWITVADDPTTTDKNEQQVGGAKLEVINANGPVLPETGGMGTTLFYVFGSIMVLGALVMLVTKKRMA